jgi:hypothetical protein
LGLVKKLGLHWVGFGKRDAIDAGFFCSGLQERAGGWYFILVSNMPLVPDCEAKPKNNHRGHVTGAHYPGLVQR